MERKNNNRAKPNLADLGKRQLRRGRRLGPVQFTVLKLVEELGDNAYGAAIQREFETQTGREISLGQIYTTLDRFEADGALSSITSSPEAVRGGRAKRIFQLEERGTKLLEESMATYRSAFALSAPI